MNSSDDRLDAVEPEARHDIQRASGRSLMVIVTVVALIVWALDQFTKHLAVTRLRPDDPVSVITGWLQWHLVRNPYAAFSLSPGRTWIITLIAASVVIVILRAVRRLGNPVWAVAMGLLLGGAIGNLTDRLFRAPGFARGHVVDFIEFLKFPFIDFPVFNVADSAIVIAAFLIALLSLRNVPFEGVSPATQVSKLPESGAAENDNA